MGGDTNGLLDAKGAAHLNGTLKLKAVGNLGDLNAEEWGAKIRTIIEADAGVNETFATEPIAYTPPSPPDTQANSYKTLGRRAAGKA